MKAANKFAYIPFPKMKTLLTLCSTKLTWILFVFHLAWNRRHGSAAKKFWLGLQFCRILQRVLQLQYLQMSGNISSKLIRWATISPCFVGARRPYRNSSKIEAPVGEGDLNKVLYREAPPLPFYIPFLTEKYPFRISFYWQMVPLSHA